MKTTVVIQDGRMQLVVTPESEAEKRMIAPFSETRGVRLDTRVDRGNFTDCVGGWLRDMKDVQSLMVGIRVVQEKEQVSDPTPPEPFASVDLRIKARILFSDVADGRIVFDDNNKYPFTEHEASTLAKWLGWHVEYRP